MGSVLNNETGALRFTATFTDDPKFLTKSNHSDLVSFGERFWGGAPDCPRGLFLSLPDDDGLREIIVQNLLRSGWSMQMIESALGSKDMSVANREARIPNQHYSFRSVGIDMQIGWRVRTDGHDVSQAPNG